jgi:hypothetical protein
MNLSHMISSLLQTKDRHRQPPTRSQMIDLRFGGEKMAGRISGGLRLRLIYLLQKQSSSAPPVCVAREAPWVMEGDGMPLHCTRTRTRAKTAGRVHMR